MRKKQQLNRKKMAKPEVSSAKRKQKKANQKLVLHSSKNKINAIFFENPSFNM